MKLCGSNIIFLPVVSLMLWLPAYATAEITENGYLISVGLSILNLSRVNNFLLQCIIVFLLVMIFGYAARILHEKKFKKE